MALLSKDSILKADDLKTSDVPVPEWGGTVRLRTLTGEERDRFEAESVEFNKKGEAKQNLKNMRARLIALVCVDENGAALFSSYDIPDLGRKSAVALDRLFAKAQEMNGFSEDDIAELSEGFDGGPNAAYTTV